MKRRWSRRVGVALWIGCAGCAQVAPRPDPAGSFWRADPKPSSLSKVDSAVKPAAFDRPADPTAAVLEPPPNPPDLASPQPVDAFIHRALAENRTVQAARFNVEALAHRIPQVTALDDPVVSNTIYPIPSVAPQYSLMGYNPYNLMIAQQFPWFGTLRLRGEAADQDVKVALAELAAAELDAVSNVKRAYFDLAFSEQAEAILTENRKLLEDFVEVARLRVERGGSQQDFLRAQVAVADLDRELIRTRQALTSARADLAQLLHVSPEADLRTTGIPVGNVPAEVDRLYQLASVARPELKGRLAAIARDERAIALARQRYYPNVTVGLSYMDMEKTNAVTPRTASGFPNVGLFVGFNLPVYRNKLAAGVCEAQARAAADARLLDAERDSTYRDIKDLFTQANAQREILGLFRATILPRSEQALEAAASDYRLGRVDYLTLITAWREVLQIRLQTAQVETELGKAIASLERAVGTQLNEHPPAAAPSPPMSPGPFATEPTSPTASPSRAP